MRRRAIGDDTGQISHAPPQPRAQRLESLSLGLPIHRGQITGHSKTDDLVHRQRAGAQTAFMAAAIHQRLQQGPARLAHVERADTLGAVELVCCKREHVDLHRLDIQRQLAGALRSIDMQGGAVCPAQGADGRNIGDGPGFVIGVHKRDQHGAGTKGGGQLLRLDAPAVPGRQVSDGEPLALELMAGIEHRLMFGARADHLGIAAARRFTLRFAQSARAARETQNGQIIGFGSTRGEDDITGPRPDQRSDAPARLFNQRPRLPPVGVGRGWIAKRTLSREALRHTRRNARIDRRRGRVIQINRRSLAHASGAGTSATLLHGREQAAHDVHFVAVQLGTLQKASDATDEITAFLRAIAKPDLGHHAFKVCVHEFQVLRGGQGLLARRLRHRGAARAHDLVADDLHRHGQIERRVALAGRYAQQRVRAGEIFIGQAAVLGPKYDGYRSPLRFGNGAHRRLAYVQDPVIVIAIARRAGQHQRAARQRLRQARTDARGAQHIVCP